MIPGMGRPSVIAQKPNFVFWLASLLETKGMQGSQAVVPSFELVGTPTPLEGIAGKTIVQVMLACNQKIDLKNISLTGSYFCAAYLPESIRELHSKGTLSIQ